jgi:hypothetical protein
MLDTVDMAARGERYGHCRPSSTWPKNSVRIGLAKDPFFGHSLDVQSSDLGDAGRKPPCGKRGGGHRLSMHLPGGITASTRQNCCDRHTRRTLLLRPPLRPPPAPRAAQRSARGRRRHRARLAHAGIAVASRRIPGVPSRDLNRCRAASDRSPNPFELLGRKWSEGDFPSAI